MIRFSRRQILKFVGTVALGPVATASSRGAWEHDIDHPALVGQSSEEWYQRPITGIGTNIWAPEWDPESITEWDPQKLADSLARAGADIAFTFQCFSED